MAKIIIEVTCGDPKVASLALSQEKEKKGLADKTRPRETEELSRKLNEQWEIYMGDKSTKRWFRLGILFPKIFRPHWERTMWFALKCFVGFLVFPYMNLSPVCLVSLIQKGKFRLS